MTSHAASRPWASRDLPRALVLFVWAAFLIGIAINFWTPIRNADWSAIHRALGLKPKAAGPALAISTVPDNDAIYTGSIFFVPRFGDYCWQRMIDNRNGLMWDKGYVACDEGVAELVENRHRGSLSTVRMQSISKAFHRDGF